MCLFGHVKLVRSKPLAAQEKRDSTYSLTGLVLLQVFDELRGFDCKLLTSPDPELLKSLRSRSPHCLSKGP